MAVLSVFSQKKSLGPLGVKGRASWGWKAMQHLIGMDQTRFIFAVVGYLESNFELSEVPPYCTVHVLYWMDASQMQSRLLQFALGTMFCFLGPFFPKVGPCSMSPLHVGVQQLWN